MTDSRPGALAWLVGSSTTLVATRELRVEATRVLEDVYRKHVNFVWRVVRRLGVPSDVAEDVVQDVFLVVRRRIGQIDAQQDVRGWLYSITRGVVANGKRARQRRARRERAAMSTPPALDPEQVAAHREAMAIVESFLATLPPRQRVVFELIDIEGLSGPQVAEVTGSPLNTVYSRLRLARRAFGRHLENQGDPR